MTSLGWCKSTGWSGRGSPRRLSKREVEVEYGISSLTGKEAGPEELLKLRRGEWKIENQSHYVRDVTFGF